MHCRSTLIASTVVAASAELVQLLNIHTTTVPSRQIVLTIIFEDALPY